MHPASAEDKHGTKRETIFLSKEAANWPDNVYNSLGRELEITSWY